MKPPLKIAAFVLGLVVVFGVAFGCGRVTSDGHDEAATKESHRGHGGHGGESTALHGTSASEAGYSFVPAGTTFGAGGAVPFSFRIADATGAAVTAFEQLHERELHLIVVRDDLTGFQHVHPTRTADGTWSVDLSLPVAGTWRAYADIDPAGSVGQLTLGVPLAVRGADAELAPAHVPATDFDVAFRRSGSTIAVDVKRAGGGAVELDPYLGARGHLVAIRRSDLGYAHVHPEDSSGSSVTFEATLPSGGYRLFFDFSVGGVVRTATTDLEVK